MTDQFKQKYNKNKITIHLTNEVLRQLNELVAHFEEKKSPCIARIISEYHTHLFKTLDK